MDPQQQHVVIVREPKSVGMAYVLCIFFGGLGLHRFYLDRIGSGAALVFLSCIGWLTIWLVIGIIPLAVVGVWVIVDLFLMRGMVRETNQRLGDAAGHSAAPQMVVNIGSEFRERANEEMPRVEVGQQPAEEVWRRQQAEARAAEVRDEEEEARRRQEDEAWVEAEARAQAEEASGTREIVVRAEAETVPRLQRLASVPETVELLPYEALNDAEEFLSRQGYEVAGRTDNSLTARQLQRFFLPDSTSAFTSIIEVLVHPEPEGGVRIDIMGHDFDPVLSQQQAQWKEWADSLPKRMEVDDVVISDAVAEPGGGVRLEKDVAPIPVQPQEVEWEGTSKKIEVEDIISDAVAGADEAQGNDGEGDLSHLLERSEATEDRMGVRLEGLFAEIDQGNQHIELNGELHARDGGELSRDIEVVATTHDSSGRVVQKQSTSFGSESFFGFEAFSLSMETGENSPAKIRVYPAEEDVGSAADVREHEAQSADGERNLSHLLERFEAAEDRWAVRLDGLFAEMDQENRHIHLNGELHASDGSELGRDIEVVATMHDSSGRVVQKQSTSFGSESFFGFEAFSLSMEAKGEMPAKIRVYPKAL